MDVRENKGERQEDMKLGFLSLCATHVYHPCLPTCIRLHKQGGLIWIKCLAVNSLAARTHGAHVELPMYANGKMKLYRISFPG